MKTLDDGTPQLTIDDSFTGGYLQIRDQVNQSLRDWSATRKCPNCRHFSDENSREWAYCNFLEKSFYHLEDAKPETFSCSAFEEVKK